MAKKKLPPGYYDPADYVLVHEKHLKRLQSRAESVDEKSEQEMAQRIAARLGRADAWQDVLDEMHGIEEPPAEAAADPHLLARGTDAGSTRDTSSNSALTQTAQVK